jgi:hypothetical protein
MQKEDSQEKKKKTLVSKVNGKITPASHPVVADLAPVVSPPQFPKLEHT